MRKMTRWMLAAILTFCGAMMMLTACTDAIGTVDNPVIPDPPYDPAGELAKADLRSTSMRNSKAIWATAIRPWPAN